MKLKVGAHVAEGRAGKVNGEALGGARNAKQALGKVSKCLGSILKKRRIEQEFTQKEFAEKISVTPTYLSQIENGKKLLALPKLYEAAEALGTTAGTMLREAEMSTVDGNLAVLSSVVQILDHKDTLTDLRELINEKLRTARKVEKEATQASVASV